MVRKFKIAALTVVALGVAAAPLVAGTNAAPRARPVAAAPARVAPADVVKARMAGFKELGAASKSVRDGLSASEMPLVTMRQAAAKIKSSSQAMRTWFPTGSGPQAGLKTSAKVEIWTKPVEFRSAQDALARQADAFQAAVATSNGDTIKAAFRSLGGACKGCHDQFKSANEHH
jgi:cytochrome c556